MTDLERCLKIIEIYESCQDTLVGTRVCIELAQMIEEGKISGRPELTKLIKIHTEGK